MLGIGFVISTCAESSSDEKKETDDAVVAVVPQGLRVDCESLDSGGSLVPDSGSRSGNVDAAQCIEYTFVGDPGITYTV